MTRKKVKDNPSETIYSIFKKSMIFSLENNNTSNFTSKEIFISVQKVEIRAKTIYLDAFLLRGMNYNAFLRLKKINKKWTKSGVFVEFSIEKWSYRP
jgi:hypothetical protein